jgi:hypothetical protein
LPKDQAKIVNQSEVTPKVASASKLISDYLKDNTIEDRTASYDKPSTNPMNFIISYKSDTRPYAVSIPTSIGVKYTRSDKKAATNSTKLIATTETFLTNLDIVKKSNMSIDVYKTSLFEGPKVVCQTSDTYLLGSRAANFELACVDTSVIESTYKELSDWLGMVGNKINTGSIASLARTDIADGANKLAVVTIVNKDKSSIILYFTTKSDKWTYVGQRPAPSVDIKDSFKLPDDLKKAIESSSNKAFLSKYIQ